MRALILGPEQKEDIKRLVDYAWANKISTEYLRGVADGTQEPVGDDVENWHAVMIPMGYRCVFSIENQPDPRLGWCRHISISIQPPVRGKGPGIEAVKMICQEFGFSDAVGHPGEGNWFGFLEQETIVNIIEPLNAEELSRIADEVEGEQQ